MSNYNCLTMMILRKCRANYEELTSLINNSKSMHMLQAGVPLIYIRDFLGHSEISTTEIYARCDSEQKRKAIENTCPSITKSETPMWQKDTSLLGWLQSL